MPELAEISRIVHFIRQHLVGKTLSKVTAQHDDIIFGKVGTSAAEFQKAMQGKKIVGAGQQGKYFWIAMSSPPHAVIHFGMSGWLKIRDTDTYYYRSDKPADKEWPPRFSKFMLETDDKTEAAFVDARRLGRVRLVDCPAEEIRKHSPLNENGPDPMIDKDIVTESWLAAKVRSKKVPIKALLLDQANISGIGNWMGDEILYHAKVHPEQYSNTLSDDQIKHLNSSMHYVCNTSVDLLADSDRFPEDWLFKHRWSKGKKNASSALPNGDKIVFITVGGRTSAVVPSVQKKGGAEANEADESANRTQSSSKRKRTATPKEKVESDAEEEETKPKRQVSKRQSKPVFKAEDDAVKTEDTASAGRRRSTRSRK